MEESKSEPEPEACAWVTEVRELGCARQPLSYGIVEVENVGSVEDATGIRRGAEWLPVRVAMGAVHSGHGGAGDATRVE